MNAVRRTAVVVLLVVFAGAFFPAVADADPLAVERLEARGADAGFLARVLERVEQLVTQLTLVFEAQEGASISPYG